MNAVFHFFLLVLAASWSVGCLIVVFLAMRPWLRRLLPARVMFGFWIVMPLLLLIPFRVPTRLSPFNVGNGSEFRAGLVATTQRLLAPAAQSRAVAAKAEPIGLSVAAPSGRSWLTERSLVVVWAVGGLSLFGLRRYLAWKFVRSIEESRRPVAPRIWEVLHSCREEQGLGTQVTVWTTGQVNAPVLFGLIRPSILLPFGFADDLSDGELRAVLAHELSHAKRGDLWVQELIHTAVAIHWFNPVVWLAAWFARQDCEHACDEFVMSRRLVSDHLQYGSTLLKAASLSCPARRAAMAIGMFENKRQIKQRIQMISAFRPSSVTRTLAGVVIVSVFGVVGLTRQGWAQAAAAVVSKDLITTTAPVGWFKNGTSATLANYVVGVDRSQLHAAAPSAYVKSLGPTDGFGGMMQTISAEAYHGKRIRFSGWIKTQDVVSGAHLWLRVDGPVLGRHLQFDNMNGRAPKGNTDWARYSIVLDVPEEATALAYGIFVEQSGQMWVSELKLDEAGKEEPTTNLNKGEGLPKAPVNLGFE